MWAFDDFTAENGATVIYPQTHLPTEEPEKHAFESFLESVSATNGVQRVQVSSHTATPAPRSQATAAHLILIPPPSRAALNILGGALFAGHDASWVSGAVPRVGSAWWWGELH